VFAVVVERLALPQTVENIESFVQQLGARLAIGDFAKLGKTGIDRAQAHGQDHPPS